MSETLSKRVGRLVSGGFHAVIDMAENIAPEAVMNENVREIERAIDEVRAELGKVLAQKHLATKKIVDESQKYDSLVQSAQTALTLGREDLVTAAISEQMDIEARLPILENTVAECVEREREFEGFIHALQAKRREMMSAIEDFRAAQSTQASTTNTGGVHGIADRVEKNSHAFDRLMSRQTGLGANSTDTKRLADLRELEELARQNRIAERLAALKAKQD
ncbi:MAG: PspA/IM30 family protein [Moraxella sp.]|nr:PspA/IM30 family protein [Moraxella sp.]